LQRLGTLVQQILTTIEVAEMNTCWSFTPMQAPIGDHIIVVSAITCPQCSIAKTVSLYRGRGQGTAACFVHTVLFRARRFTPHNVDTAKEHQPARTRTH
jgi:hypothetical protein